MEQYFSERSVGKIHVHGKSQFVFHFQLQYHIASNGSRYQLLMCDEPAETLNMCQNVHLFSATVQCLTVRDGWLLNVDKNELLSEHVV